MTKNIYYRTVIQRNSMLKSQVQALSSWAVSYPRLVLEVFIRKNFGERYFFMPTAVIVFLACICFINTALCDNHITDYCYQITHPLHGPLDYYIPAIKERFPHPENLVIATNYEEMSYEYYLGCKVILGFQNHFISVDKDTGWQQYRPDVIILRPSWYQDNRPYKFYFQHAQYKKITFPVKDQPVNDVTDLYFFMKHHFRTVFAEGEDDRAAMYVKDGVW